MTFFTLYICSDSYQHHFIGFAQNPQLMERLLVSPVSSHLIHDVQEDGWEGREAADLRRMVEMAADCRTLVAAYGHCSKKRTPLYLLLRNGLHQIWDSGEHLLWKYNLGVLVED